MENGKLVYEYNMMIIERYTVEAGLIAPGRHKIEITSLIPKPMAPGDITITVDGKQVGKGTVTRTVPAAFSASESFDVGLDMGAPVSLRYHEKAPFKYNGKIYTVKVDLLP